jgi:hypothetical protein
MKMMVVKEAEIHPRTVSNHPLMLASWRTARFSLDEARRALPYLARVVRDASHAYHEAQRWRHQLDAPWTSRERRRLADERDAALRRLDSAIDECNAVGADLVDLDRGVVRLGAIVDGRAVNLTWRLGEPVTNAWQNGRESSPQVETVH